MESLKLSTMNTLQLSTMDTMQLSTMDTLQWSDPVSLTFHCVLKKLYTEPSIFLPTKVRVHFVTRFRGEEIKINQSAIRIACGGLVR
jgi:hypothetical protein